MATNRKSSADTKAKVERQKSKADKKVSSEKVQSATKSAKKAEKIVGKDRLSLTLDVFDLKGEVAEKISLPKEIFAVPINDSLMAQAVRVYLANQRRGTSKTKSRGEVKGSSRKIYRQKGTGRARHGSIRAPIFVHGGVVFGPTPRDYSLKLPKKMRKAALFSALASKLKEKQIKIIKGLEKVEPKTKAMVNVLGKLGLEDKNKNILLILPSVVKKDASKPLGNIKRATRNIEGVGMTYPDLLNTYEVLNAKVLLFADEAISNLRNHFLEK